jgi:hypothetical protein
MFDEYGTYNYVGGADGDVELFLPDKLFLFCNRGDPGGEAMTWLHDQSALYAMIPEEDKELLRDQNEHLLRFFDGADTAGGRESQVAYRESVAPQRTTPSDNCSGTATDNPSVVSGTNEAPRVSMQESRPVNRELSERAAADAYDRLFALAQATRVGVPLAAGDLLILKNNRTLHGRSPYTPHYDDNDRWVQRFTSYQPQQVEEAEGWLAEQHRLKVAQVAVTASGAKL